MKEKWKFMNVTSTHFTPLAGLTNFMAEKLLSKRSVIFGRSFIGVDTDRFEKLWNILISTVLGPYVYVPDILVHCLGVFYFRTVFFSLLATLLCCVFNIYLNDDELELGQTIRRFSLKQMHSSRNILPNFICFVTGILSAYWYWIDYFPANSTSPCLGVSI